MFNQSKYVPLFVSAACLTFSLCYGQSDTPPAANHSISAGGQAAVKESSALDFVRNLGSRAIETLTKKNLSDQERRNRFTTLFHEYFAGNEIGKFVLGRYWRRATSAQQNEYLKLFTRSVAATYAVRFSEYKPDDTFEVLKELPQPDQSIKVKSVLKRPIGTPITFTWVLYKSGDSYKIYDVIIEGVSMSISQRSEYSSLIQRNGGSIQDFLSELSKTTPS